MCTDFGLQGSQGLERLDNVIKTAGKYDIKVILTFTNNWVGYGGSELYLNHIVGSNATHDQFYSDKRVIASYRMFSHNVWPSMPFNKSLERYVETIVNRYKSSPNIFAWELINEARCSGDLPSSLACSVRHPSVSLIVMFKSPWLIGQIRADPQLVQGAVKIRKVARSAPHGHHWRRGPDVHH
jgi:hypothetical protein